MLWFDLAADRSAAGRRQIVKPGLLQNSLDRKGVFKMPEKQVLLTVEGLRAFEEELEYLKTIKRKEISKQIQIARSFGDLSENSEYDEAMNEQAQVEARIAEIEAALKHVKIIDEDEVGTSHVQVGAKVKVHDVELDMTEEYQIVGSTEANPLKGSISDESPVGKALLGHAAGDDVYVETPSGIIHYHIVSISR